MLESSTAMSPSSLVCLPVYAANTAEEGREHKARREKMERCRDWTLKAGPLCASGNVSEML